MVFHRLVKLAKTKEVLFFDEILELLVQESLSLDLVERLYDELIKAGVLIREKVAVVEEDGEEELLYDKSKIDYDSLFDQALSIDPSLITYIDELRKIEPPQKNEERELVHHMKNGNSLACERLIKMNLRVAFRIAFWFHEKHGFSLEETIQDANVGLIMAAKKMPNSYEGRFSSYAPFWISQIIVRKTMGFGNKGEYITAQTRELLMRARASIQHYRDKYGEENEDLVIHSLSDELNIGASKAMILLRIIQPPISIEDSLDNNHGERFNDNEKCLYLMNSAILKDELNYQVQQCLNTLKDRETLVLRWRYGFVDGLPHTLEEIGQVLNVSRERIRQIEKKAIKRIMESSKCNILKEFLAA